MILPHRSDKLLEPYWYNFNRFNDTGQRCAEPLGGNQIVRGHHQTSARFRLLGRADNADDLVDLAIINMIENENAWL
ncbi:hypothetical protein GCM10017621_03890 [Maricaulis virginensis]|uniref:Uncharacterized protein n=1 Tax=Maricaulis virginensis TaxID=144022 RepID=A0A9W6IID1_9PROT|nr:hypothetical protein GCM10017621_03890 [Maricaulis virginensis]